MQLDPRNVDNLLSLAVLLGDAHRFDQSQSIIDRALKISPDNDEAHADEAINFLLQGRLSDSAAVLNRIRADSPVVIAAVAREWQLRYERRFEEVIAQVKSNIPPAWANDPRTITFLGYYQEWAGYKGDAEQTFKRAITAIQPTPGAAVAVDARTLDAFLALAYAGLNEKEKALEQAQRALTTYKDDALSRVVVETFLAQIQARFGDADSAIAALPHLLESPASVLRVTRAALRLDPMWDPLRKDPRFQELCEEPNK
jgi:tetratricopeptide (TPR) repeat protein